MIRISIRLYISLGHQYRCNSTLMIQFKCDDGYGITASKSKAVGVHGSKKKKNKTYFKQHVKRKCNSAGKLLLKKIPKCISLQNRKNRNNKRKG